MITWFLLQFQDEVSGATFADKSTQPGLVGLVCRFAFELLENLVIDQLCYDFFPFLPGIRILGLVPLLIEVGRALSG
jgi:hypothetical protein